MKISLGASEQNQERFVGLPMRVAVAAIAILLAALQPNPHLVGRDVLSLLVLVVLLWFFPQLWRNRRGDIVPVIVVSILILVAALQVWSLVLGALSRFHLWPA